MRAPTPYTFRTQPYASSSSMHTFRPCARRPQKCCSKTHLWNNDWLSRCYQKLNQKALNIQRSFTLLTYSLYRCFIFLTSFSSAVYMWENSETHRIIQEELTIQCSTPFDMTAILTAYSLLIMSSSGSKFTEILEDLLPIIFAAFSLKSWVCDLSVPSKRTSSFSP